VTDRNIAAIRIDFNFK